MINLVNSILKSYLAYRKRRIDHFKKFPHEVQNHVFHTLIANATHTEWGQKYGYRSINNYRAFRAQVPISTYDDLAPYIKKMMDGKPDVLWPGPIYWYSKSSGTSADKSKFIPVSKVNLEECHIMGSWDTVVQFYGLREDARIFFYKNLILPGSISTYEGNPKTKYGDISALMIEHMPAIGRAFYEPPRDVALIADFEKKIDITAELVAARDDIGMFGGVPTWLIVLFRKVLELTGKDNLLEVWPNLQAYFHGGVAFGPYKKQFETLIPDPQFSYFEIYNASEGYFAVQDDFGSDDMLLLLDNGIFYEFVKKEEWMATSDPEAHPIWEVETGKEYVMLISTNGGLWRYVVGDTITFTNVVPYKIKITGRISQYINVFGEEVMVSNVEKAIERTSETTNAVVREYTAGPIYMTDKTKGGHEYAIEFDKAPEDAAQFARLLDTNLQRINSDYEAKRLNDLALQPLRMVVLPQGTFYKWMKKRNRLGGQAKVPRLSNDRRYLDEVLALDSEQKESANE